MGFNPVMEILRQRLYISHDDRRQHRISIECTIRSKVNGLKNIIILSQGFLPNLTVCDEQGDILPVMPRQNLENLIKDHTSNKDMREENKLKDLYSEIESENWHFIWIKIPNKKEIDFDEIRTITLKYSPRQKNIPNSILKTMVKSKPYSLYYNFASPIEFDFDKVKFNYLENNKIKQSLQPPNHVQKFYTSDSILLRISPGADDSFEVKYSFKPKSDSTSSLKIGLMSLLGFSSLMLASKLATLFDYLPDMEIFARQTEIGLFMIGSSLILPQLVHNPIIRARYKWYYFVPMILGATLMFL